MPPRAAASPPTRRPGPGRTRARHGSCRQGGSLGCTGFPTPPQGTGRRPQADIIRLLLPTGFWVIGARCCRTGGSGATVGTRCAGSVPRRIRCFSCGGRPLLSHRRRNRPRHRGLFRPDGTCRPHRRGEEQCGGHSRERNFGGARGPATGISRSTGRIAIQNRLNRHKVRFCIDLCIINYYNVPPGTAFHDSCPQGGAGDGNTIIRVPMRMRAARPRTGGP